MQAANRVGSRVGGTANRVGSRRSGNGRRAAPAAPSPRHSCRPSIGPMAERSTVCRGSTGPRSWRRNTRPARHPRGRDQGAGPVADRAGGQRRVPDRHRRVRLAAGRDPGQSRQRPLHTGADDRGDRPSARARHPHPRGAWPCAGLSDRVEGGRHAEECRRAPRRADDPRHCWMGVAGAAEKSGTKFAGMSTPALLKKAERVTGVSATALAGAGHAAKIGRFVPFVGGVVAGGLTRR